MLLIGVRWRRTTKAQLSAQSAAVTEPGRKNIVEFRFGDQQQCPLHFQHLTTLLYFAAFSIVSARERRWFWATMPSETVVAANHGGCPTGTILTRVGLPGLMPLPWSQTLAIVAYAMFVCLVVNDVVKVAMIKWRVPTAAA